MTQHHSHHDQISRFMPHIITRRDVEKLPPISAAELEAAAREFEARGGRVTVVETPEPAPIPARTSWIDPEAKLKRSSNKRSENDVIAEKARKLAERGLIVSEAAAEIGCCRDRLARIAYQKGIVFAQAGSRFRAMADSFEEKP